MVLMRETLAQNETALEAWTTANKAELFTEARSVEMNRGKIGFRWTPWRIVALKKLKVETIIERLRAEDGAPDLQNRERRQRKGAQLRQRNAPLGTKKVHTDGFFYEVKREEVKS